MCKKTNPNDPIRSTFTERLPALELAIQSLAKAIGGPAPDHSTISDFFHSMMDGCWDPFEEVTRLYNDELRQANKLALQKQSQILELLGDKHRGLLEEYCDLDNLRVAKELEYAFLVGYQCAFKFILLGLLPQAGLIQDASSTGEGADCHET